MPLWAEIAGGSAASATSVSIIGAAVLRFATKYVERVVAQAVEEKIAPNNEATEAVKLELARQFGGNSGGMRQAINELAAEVAYLKGAAGLPKDH